jgi:diguanylate cyclase (GGDEF)-like protein
MEDCVLTQNGRRPGHPSLAGPLSRKGAPGRGGTRRRIDLAAAERVTTAVDQLLATVPQDASVVAVRRWLLAVDRLLPMAREYDRARLLQACAGVWAAVPGEPSPEKSCGQGEDVSDAMDAAELFEQLGDSLSAATNFAVAATIAAHDGRITVALETAVRALVALGSVVRNGERDHCDPDAEARLAARLGTLCRQLFDYPRALRFYELALDALDGAEGDDCGSATTLAVAELLLVQVSELPAEDPQRSGMLGRVEQLAHELAASARPEVIRRLHAPRLLAEVRCERGRPEEAWPLLLGIQEALDRETFHGLADDSEPESSCGPEVGCGAGATGAVHLSAGRCLLLLGRHAEAVTHLDRAVDLLETPGDFDEPHLAELLVALRLRSSAREEFGDVLEALADARRVADLLWLRHRRHVGGFMDQVWSRAGAEEERRDLQERTEALLVRAEQDPLTGLANRWALERICSQLLPAAVVSLVLVDVDHFKAVNDRYGHVVGDAVLRSLATVLTRSVRTMDVVARWGGEEFLIALPGGSERLGADAAERVCRRVRTYPWRQLAEGLGVTVSVGVASGPVAELDITLSRADAALYRAKRTGRDRTVVG